MIFGAQQFYHVQVGGDSSSSWSTACADAARYDHKYLKSFFQKHLLCIRWISFLINSIQDFSAFSSLSVLHFLFSKWMNEQKERAPALFVEKFFLIFFMLTLGEMSLFTIFIKATHKEHPNNSFLAHFNPGIMIQVKIERFSWWKFTTPNALDENDREIVGIAFGWTWSENRLQLALTSMIHTLYWPVCWHCSDTALQTKHVNSKI